MKPARHDSKQATLRGRNLSVAPTGATTKVAVPVALFSPILCRDEELNENEHGSGTTDVQLSMQQASKVRASLYNSVSSENAIRIDQFVDSPQHEETVQNEFVTTTPIKSLPAATSLASTPPSEGSTSSAVSASDEEDPEDVFNPFVFIVNLPPRETIPDSNKICLPPLMLTSRPTLVLDLDETLVHCTVEKIDGADMTFPVDCNGMRYEVHVRKRPYLDYFLQTVAKTFEVSHMSPFRWLLVTYYLIHNNNIFLLLFLLLFDICRLLYSQHHKRFMPMYC